MSGPANIASVEAGFRNVHTVWLNRAPTNLGVLHAEKQFVMVVQDIFPASLSITEPAEGHRKIVESERC